MAKKKKRKVPARTILKRLKVKADKALSEYVRKQTTWAYALCPLCNVNPVHHNFHFISRKRAILRWDIRNCIGSCKGCNLMENYWPDLSRAFYIRTFGVDQYLALVDESRKSFVPTPLYLQGIIDGYTEASSHLV